MCEISKVKAKNMEKFNKKSYSKKATPFTIRVRRKFYFLLKFQLFHSTFTNFQSKMGSALPFELKPKLEGDGIKNYSMGPLLRVGTTQVPVNANIWNAIAANYEPELRHEFQNVKWESFSKDKDDFYADLNLVSRNCNANLMIKKGPTLNNDTSNFI